VILEITPLDAPLGAMMRGWNPKAPLSSDDLGLLRQAMREHLVLLLRGHTQPTDAELVRFGGQSGELVKGSELFGLNSVAEILRINNVVDETGEEQGLLASSDLDWRADYSFMPVAGFVVFDTLGTQHRRSAFDPSERRSMRQLSTMWTPPAHRHPVAAEQEDTLYSFIAALLPPPTLPPIMAGPGFSCRIAGDQCARDDLALQFIGAFADGQQWRVAVIALDIEFTRIAIGAVNAHAFEAVGQRRLGSKQLGHARLHVAALTQIIFFRGRAHQ